MSTLSERAQRKIKDEQRAVVLQARYGGVVKQAILALDNVGNGDFSTALAEGRFTLHPIESGVVLEDIPDDCVLVCCGGVSRRRRGAPFTFLIKRTRNVATPMGRPDATGALLQAPLRPDPGTAVLAEDVLEDGDSKLPDKVRAKGKSKS